MLALLSPGVMAQEPHSIRTAAGAWTQWSRHLHRPPLRAGATHPDVLPPNSVSDEPSMGSGHKTQEVRGEPNSHPGLQTQTLLFFPPSRPLKYGNILVAPGFPPMSAVPQNRAGHIPEQGQTRTEAGKLYTGQPSAGRGSGLCHPGVSMGEETGTQRRSW